MWAVVSGALETVGWVIGLACKILGKVNTEVVDKVADAVPASLITWLF